MFVLTPQYRCPQTEVIKLYLQRAHKRVSVRLCTPHWGHQVQCCGTLHYCAWSVFRQAGCYLYTPHDPRPNEHRCSSQFVHTRVIICYELLYNQTQCNYYFHFTFIHSSFCHCKVWWTTLCQGSNISQGWILSLGGQAGGQADRQLRERGGLQ